MRIVTLAFAAGLACAQTADLRERIFYFSEPKSSQQFMEAATVIRTIADIKDISANSDQKTLTVHATPAQIAISEWLFNEIDTSPPPTAVSHEYKVPGPEDDLVRIFFLPYAPSVQDFQEIATLVRTISNIQRVFTYNGSKALALRGSQTQVELADWLVGALDPAKGLITGEYRVPGTDDDVVGVLYLPHTATVQDFQKAATRIREAAQIRRIFTYNTPRALALRGTAQQIAQAARLVQELDKP